MGGGVNPLEWLVPPVALSHMAYNAGAQQVSPRAKVTVPGSPVAKQKTAQQDAAEQQRQLGLAQTAKDEEAERLRVENLPENVRRRAGSAAQQLGATGGKRPSASTYLSGVSA